MQRSAWFIRQLTRSRRNSPRSSSFAFGRSSYSPTTSKSCCRPKAHQWPLLTAERQTSTDVARDENVDSSQASSEQLKESSSLNAEPESSSESGRSSDVYSLRVDIYERIRNNGDVGEIERLTRDLIALCGSREELQRDIVAYFDETITKSRSSVSEKTSRSRPKMSTKLTKLVGRLLKSFDLPLSTAQNLHRTSCENSVKLFSYRRFMKKAMSGASFHDSIQGVLEVNTDMRRFVIDYLSEMENAEALEYARRLEGLSDGDALNVSLDAQPHSRSSPSEVLTLPKRIRQATSMVDTKNGLIDCLNHVFASTSSEELVIGLDTEFMPGFLAFDEQAAMLQVATKDRVFLIDLFTLTKQLNEQEWIHFFDQLLCSENAIKIGFEFLYDLRVLNATLPFCRDAMSKANNVVCLAKLFHNLCQADSSLHHALHLSKTNEGSLTSNTTDTSELPPLGFGLSDLCAFLLRQPLDKSWQLSHWAKRPLHPEQIHYAALDAYCQIQIFYELKKKAKELSIDWDDVVARSTVSLGQAKKKRPSSSRSSSKRLADIFEGPSRSVAASAQLNIDVTTTIRQKRPLDLSLNEEIDHFKQFTYKYRRFLPEDVKEFNERIVKRLQEGDEEYLNYLQKSPGAVNLLISCCGTAMSMLTISQRMYIFSRLWQVIKKHGIERNIRLCNTALRVFLDNNVDFDPDEVLKQLATEELQPDSDTVSCLITQYCKSGDVGTALTLLDQMKSLNVAVPESALYDMAFGYTLIGSDNRVDQFFNWPGYKELAQSSQQDPSTLLRLHSAVVRANASKGDLVGMASELKQMDGLKANSSDSARVVYDLCLLDIYATLVDHSRDSNYLRLVLTRMPDDTRDQMRMYHTLLAQGKFNAANELLLRVETQITGSKKMYFFNETSATQWLDENWHSIIMKRVFEPTGGMYKIDGLKKLRPLLLKYLEDRLAQLPPEQQFRYSFSENGSQLFITSPRKHEDHRSY